MNNVEKHRLLLTVGGQAAGLNVGHLLSSAKIFTPKAAAAFESMDVFIVPSDQGFSLAPGFQLYTGDVDEPPNPQQQFRFTIALSEPGLVEGDPLVSIVGQLVEAVDSVVTDLKPRLLA